MNVGIILSVGDGFRGQSKSGQLSRFIKYYLYPYSQFFDKVFIFEYESPKTKQELKNYNLPANCVLISNKLSFHRYIYSFLMPVLNWKEFMQVNKFRVMQATGGLPAIFANIIYKKKYIVTFGFDYHSFAEVENQKLQSILIKPLVEYVLKFSDKVIVTNKTISLSLLKNVKPKTIFIPNGVDTQSFKPKDKKEADVKKILFVGRLETQKNLGNLISAIGDLEDKKNLSLTLVGEGSLKRKLIQLAKEKKVNLMIKSPIAHEKLPSLMREYDLFVLVSLIEGHPKVLLEAMAVGMPCLVSQAQGNMELSENGSNCLVCGFESEEITQGLQRLLTDSKMRKNISENARNFIAKKYDIQQLVDREIILLRKL